MDHFQAGCTFKRSEIRRQSSLLASLASGQDKTKGRLEPLTQDKNGSAALRRVGSKPPGHFLSPHHIISHHRSFYPALTYLIGSSEESTLSAKATQVLSYLASSSCPAGMQTFFCPFFLSVERWWVGKSVPQQGFSLGYTKTEQ